MFDVLTEVCSEDIDSDLLGGVEKKVHRVLALVERDFPVSMQVIVFHLLHHLPMFLKRFGPVYTFWMYPYERFNSWIIRRVLNRRYPEATVVETYRLTEWASFMALSGQLVKGSITSTEAEEDSGPLSTVAENMNLSADMVEDLRTYYLKKVPEFAAFTEQYTKEREQAKMNHKLMTFPVITEWLPKGRNFQSSQLSELRCGPSCNAVSQKSFMYEDTHGRSIVLSSTETDKEHTYRRNSYIATTDGSCRVGRIVTLFEHRFLSCTGVFAFVSLFDGPYKDPESKLSYVLASGQMQTVVPIVGLSKPLVIAQDDDESDKKISNS